MSKVEKIIDELKTLTLMEASELVKSIEETFGVSAAAPVAIAAAPSGASEVAAVEEKTEFDVKVTQVPADKKISVIKEVKNILNIGLAEAKTKVESAPFILIEKANKDDANKYKDLLSAAGATVTLE
ncbi:MAG: 50S ribosomal protein L7/L12 [candidate division SR1 bacterium]|nr:50S ribosomal protein L7/L12 [candidate division SR1 bacterium]